MSARISLITLTHNKLECTRLCLSSWLATRGVRWELVVVDNGSTDGTCEWLEDYARSATAGGVPVKTIRNPGNIGCSTARNQGAEQASGELLVFLDNDTALRQRDWLARLAAVLEADPGAAMVGPKLVYPWAPHRIQCAGAAVSPAGRVQFMGRGEQRDDPQFNVRREVQCLISACCMVRRTAFAAAHGFDSAFNPVEYEDIDLCYRIRSRGHRILYEPSAELYHFESVTTAGTRALPNTYLIVKHGLLFKQRWRHLFEQENGPPDEATRWRKVEARPFQTIGTPPVVD